MMTTEYSQAYWEGVDAALDGTDDCPYLHGSPERREWLCGYQIALPDREERLDRAA